MRRLGFLLLTVALVGSAFVSPANAGKRTKKVAESFEAQAVPFVNSQATGTERRSCFGGVEDVHWVAQDFTSPGKGTLTASLEGFTGDWDIALELPDGVLIYGINDQTTEMAPAEEEVSMPLKKGDAVRILACNFLGEPGPLTVNYGGKFKV